MVRTQIYLTKEEKEALEELAGATGQSQSELIRAAIDAFLARYLEHVRLDRLQQASGLWRDRDDLPEFARIREELDRF